MKISHLTGFVPTFCFAILLLTQTASAQTTSCDNRYGYGGGPINVSALTDRLEVTCNTTPADHNITQGTGEGFRAICKDCVPSEYGPERAYTAGTEGCTAYGKKLVIEFQSPVAELYLPVNGARTVTDNRGMTVQVDPDGGLAYFPGGGITSVTISNPREFDAYYANGQLYAHGAWEIWTSNASWVYDFDYQPCNCNRPAITTPAPQSPFSPDWNSNGIPDWRMDAEISQDDGLVLKNVRLENRYMAEKISVPYYFLETNSIPIAQRGELKPNSSDPTMASRLVDFDVWNDDEKLVVEARYVISGIPAGSENCLHIVQRYEFHKRQPGDKCEPSGKLPCARWNPIVTYRFSGPEGELRAINIPQRFHYRVNGFNGNGVGLFRDCDELRPCLLGGGIVFREKTNPLSYELGSNVIIGGKSANRWDNFHQTFKYTVDEPATFPNFRNPGCPECVHTHWRWGTVLDYSFSSGKVLTAADSNQDVDIAVTRFRSGEEEDPSHYLDLLTEPEPIQTPGYLSGSLYDYAAEDVVFWYSSTGHQPSDTFFPTPGAFFNPSFEGYIAPVADTLPGDSPTTLSKDKKDMSINSSTDRPVSVAFADLYADGPTGFEFTDPSSLGALPSGYAVYDADVYQIASNAIVSGPHVVDFNVPSVGNEDVFGSLRILHLEPDSFDPAKGRLVDRTVLSPESPAPDFAGRTISARVNGLGTFVLATKQPAPPNTDLADLSVSVADSTNSVAAGTNLTYTITLRNDGPQPAEEVMLKDSLPPEAEFISVTTTDGTCREFEGNVLCTVSTLASGADATVTVVVKPSDGGSEVPAGGIPIRNVAMIKSDEGDSNLANNTFIETTMLLPDPNLAPTISVSSPVTGTAVVGPTNIVIEAEASDSDGSIAEVNFYDNGNLLGAGTPTGGNQYTFTWNNGDFGPHALIAVAVDDDGKSRSSEPVNLLVNGSATVAITSPVNLKVFNRPTDVVIRADASLTGGTIDRVDFYADGFLLGEGTFSVGQYSFTWTAPPAGNHSLVALVIDADNIATASTAVNIFLNDPPVIALTSPTTGTVVPAGTVNFTLTANANDWNGGVRRVDFLANGVLIGSSATAGANQFSFVWQNAPAGTYSLSAVAIDNYDAITTSAPVNIRINSAPTGSFVNPPGGSQFISPASITLLANASDFDGTVSKVEFFANGYRVGIGTPIGGNQFQFVWNNVGIGSYGFTAYATDNDGARTGISGTIVTVTAPILFVTGSTTLSASDAAIRTRLENLGYTVTVKDGASSTTADAAGKAVVVISSTITPASVGTKFRTVAVPVVLWESGLFVNMGMTPSGNQNSGTTNNQTQVQIANSSHPLAAALSGNQTVSASNAMSWGKPNANASSVATLVGDTTKSVIFGYQTGAVMPGLTAPANRVGLYMSDVTASSFSTNGGKLFDAAIKWASGGSILTGSFASLSPGSVNLTNEGLAYWTHWGHGSFPQFDHKDVLTQLISGYATLGTSAVNSFADNLVSYSWSDGQPTVSTSGTTTGVFVNNTPGNGFEVTIPADTNLKTLKIYVGVWFAQGRLEAAFTDGSAPVYVDTSIGAAPGRSNGVYTIQFKSAAPSQTLRIRYTIQTNHFPPYGNVTLESMALR
jgi:uncharacterized repeat protein (TIGR01451 family)